STCPGSSSCRRRIRHPRCIRRREDTPAVRAASCSHSCRSHRCTRDRHHTAAGGRPGVGPPPSPPRETPPQGADSRGVAGVLLGGDDGGCWPGPDEQPAARRTAAMGTIREKSSGVVEERTGHPSLLQEAEAASPKTPDAYYLRLVAAAARGNTNNFLSSRL